MLASQIVYDKQVAVDDVGKIYVALRHERRVVRQHKGIQFDCRNVQNAESVFHKLVCDGVHKITFADARAAHYEGVFIFHGRIFVAIFFEKFIVGFQLFSLLRVFDF